MFNIYVRHNIKSLSAKHEGAKSYMIEQNVLRIIEGTGTVVLYPLFNIVYVEVQRVD